MTYDRFFDEFYTLTGIVFDNKRPIIEAKIARFFKERGYADLQEYYRVFQSDPGERQELVNLLTTSETYFYREIAQIEVLIDLLRSQNRSSVKILCAPCASGEEPYSILIALAEAGFPVSQIEIHGIDINSDEIFKAVEGRYTARRLHRLDPAIREKYFTPDGDSYRILPSLRAHVHFRVQNIFDAWPAALEAFDIVFSRNMLIYFDAQSRHKAQQILTRKLRSGGFLFVGHADNLQPDPALLKQLQGRVAYYLKS